jgi:hypothetical protein
MPFAYGKLSRDLGRRKKHANYCLMHWAVTLVLLVSLSRAFSVRKYKTRFFTIDQSKQVRQKDSKTKLVVNS